jgi:hypothetical protein
LRLLIVEYDDEILATNTQDPTWTLIFGRDNPNHPLNHTKVKKAYLKRILLPNNFE